MLHEESDEEDLVTANLMKLHWINRLLEEIEYWREKCQKLEETLDETCTSLVANDCTRLPFRTLRASDFTSEDSERGKHDEEEAHGRPLHENPDEGGRVKV